jgi:plasmid stabilization system protein ParE
MKTFIWTDLALKDYHENIDYLLQEWSEKEALIFIEDVEEVLSSLQTGKIEYKESNYHNIRECVVCKQITLYYRHLSNKEIELLCFWNNSKDKQRLKF